MACWKMFLALLYMDYLIHDDFVKNYNAEFMYFKISLKMFNTCLD